MCKESIPVKKTMMTTTMTNGGVLWSTTKLIQIACVEAGLLATIRIKQNSLVMEASVSDLPTVVKQNGP